MLNSTDKILLRRVWWSVVLYFGMSYLAQHLKMQVRMTIFSYLLRAKRSRLLAIPGVRIWSHGFQLIECVVYLTCAQGITEVGIITLFYRTLSHGGLEDLFILAVSTQHQWALDYEWECLMQDIRAQALWSPPVSHMQEMETKQKSTELLREPE